MNHSVSKKLFMSISLVVGLLGISSEVRAQDAPVQYVKICSLYGDGFHYIPGTDTCMNDVTGDSRQQTEGGTWRTFLPYPEGVWVSNQQQACTPGGKLMKVGDFKSTDFSLNAHGKLQSFPVNFPLTLPQFISKVMMSGGFYDPRVQGQRSGVTSMSPGLCLRSIDPDVLELQGNGTFLNPPYGDGALPIGCIANSRIVGMPAAYAISAQAAYPQIDKYLPTADQSVLAGPYAYGDQLVVTTDVFSHGPDQLSYSDNSGPTPVIKPLAGTLSVSVCVDGVPSQNSQN